MDKRGPFQCLENKFFHCDYETFEPFTFSKHIIGEFNKNGKGRVQMKHISREKAEKLFSWYSGYVFKTVFLLCKSKELAEDVTQETFIKIFQKYHLYNSEKPLKPWIYKVALNTLRAEIRKRKWLTLSPDIAEYQKDPNNTENEVIRKEYQELINEAIQSLSYKYREILILYYYNEFTHKEIAEILSIPIGTCKSRLHYAHKKLYDTSNVQKFIKGVNGIGNSEFAAYWDIFHKGDEWVYARQNLDPRSERILDEEEMKTTFNLPENSKVIPLTKKDGIAILTDLGKYGKKIDMLVRNNKNQVIYFEIRGNIKEDRLIELARAYRE